MKLKLILPCASFIFLLFAAAMFSAAQDTKAPASPAPSADKQNCTFAGMVVNAVGGAPVRKATVRLLPEAGGLAERGQSATTDAEGHFVFNDLPPARYRLSVSHPAFINYPNSRRQHLWHNGVVYGLSPGQQIKDVAIRLTPGAVLRGRVTDEDGDPVPRAQVHVQSEDGGGNDSRRLVENLISGGSGNTDDQGEFRIFSVQPGRYYLVVDPPVDVAAMMAAVSAKAEPRAYVRTFYPSTTRRESATVLELAGGGELSVNVGLLRENVYPVSGVLKGAKGPVAMGMVMAMQSTSPTSTSSVKDGKFELHLPVGHYNLMGMGIDENFSPDNFLNNNARTTIDVPEGGVRDISLVIGNEASAPVQVTGHIRAENGALPAGQHWIVNLHPLKTGRNDDEFDIFSNAAQAMGGFGTVKSDGSFDLKKVFPGNYEIVVSGTSQSPQSVDAWYLKSAITNGRDVLNSGFNPAGAGQQLELVLSSRGGSLDGSVQDKDHHPAANSLVVLVPDEARAKRHSLYQTAITDQNGKFQFRGLEPGDYTAYAWDDIDDDAWFNADIMKHYKDDGAKVTVHAGERANLDVKRITNSAE